MAENKKSVIIYTDWGSIYDKLTDEEAGRLVKHFFDYVRDKNPTAPDRLTEITFEPMKLQLKRDLEKWDVVKEKRSVAGKKSAETKKTAQQTSTNSTHVDFVQQNSTHVEKAQQTSTNSTVNVNDNVNVTVNVNEEREEHAHETFEPNVIYTSPETETEEQRKVAPKKSNYVLLGKDEVVRRIKEDESQTKEYAVFQLNLSNDEFLLSVDMFVGEKGEDGLKRDYGEILKHYRSWLKLNIKIIKNLSKNGNKTQEKYFGIPTDSLKRTHDALLNS